MNFRFNFQTAKFSNSQNLQTKKPLAHSNIKTTVRASRRDAPESLKELSAQKSLVRPWA